MLFEFILVQSPEKLVRKLFVSKSLNLDIILFCVKQQKFKIKIIYIYKRMYRFMQIIADAEVEAFRVYFS